MYVCMQICIVVNERKDNSLELKTNTFETLNVAFINVHMYICVCVCSICLYVNIKIKIQNFRKSFYNELF